jgi:porin
MFSDRVKIKVGKQDASFDIGALASGLNFLGNSFAYIPTTAPLPYYPEPAMGTLLTIKPTNWLSLKSGFYDGNAKGGKSGFDTVFGENRSTFFVEELGIKHNLNNHPGNYFAGYTLHTAHKDELADTVSHTYSNNPSMYLGGEQMIYKENKDDAADDQGLTMLGQFGWTPSDRNKLCQYYGTGLQYKGLISNRNSDIVGIGTSIGKFSDRLQNMTSDGRQGTESIIEMFYKFQLNKWLAIVPDLQVVIHPGAQQKSSFLMGLRFNVTL